MPHKAALSTIHLLVSGKVQGVFFRKHTKAAATKLGVTGWVRNLPDGRVEVLAEGTAQQLTDLTAWCHKGSPKSKVEGVAVVHDDEDAGDAAAPEKQRDDAQEGSSGQVSTATGARKGTGGGTQRKFATFDILR